MGRVKRKKRPESEATSRLNFRFVAAWGSGKIVKGFSLGARLPLTLS
jgi:hypothetical protein